jgi:hypothetical protein
VIRDMLQTPFRPRRQTGAWHDGAVRERPRAIYSSVRFRKRMTGLTPSLIVGVVALATAVIVVVLFTFA